jgi:uncharacterized protein (DUF305 family)
MRRSTLALITAVAVLVSALSATALWGFVSSTGLLARPAMGGMMSSSSTPGRGPGWQGPGTGMHGPAAASEADWLTEMVAHHQEAVDSAAQLQRSDRPRMREFGASIVRTQAAQIELMNRWLERWHPGRAPDADYQPMMRDLTSLNGDALDRAFLQDMVGHHMAAVMMSQQLLVRGTAEHEEVNELAATIRDEQHAEIFQMRRWLADWFYTGSMQRSGCGVAAP